VQPVDTGYFWQAPRPSQRPLFRHVGEPSSLQLFFGSVPAPTGEHEPLATPVSVVEHA
jgi:hypothetical protein